MKNPNFQYSGKHEKNPPDPNVIIRVTDMLDTFKSYGITARSNYFDEQNMYHIEFAWEGIVFLSLYYTAGREECLVEEEHGVQVSAHFLTTNELRFGLQSKLLRVLGAKEKKIGQLRNRIVGDQISDDLR